MPKSVVRQEDEDFGKDHGLIHEAVLTGRKVGAGREFWSKLAHDEEFFAKVVKLLQTGGYEPTVSQKRAREIMGRNFFGVEEATKHFGVSPTRQQLAVLSEIPFTEAMLEECKNTHILVAVFPLSILDIRDKVNHSFFSHEDVWCNQAFAKDKGEVGWHLVRKTLFMKPTGENWNEQRALLSENEETPTDRIMVYTIIGYYLATSERLFCNFVVYLDMDSRGRRVPVDRFGGCNGAGVYYYWDD